jgi:hypothetical protein
MRCEDIGDELFDISSEDLLSKDPRVLAHLETCRRCQEAVTRARAVWSVLGAATNVNVRSAAMRERFDTVLRGGAPRLSPGWTLWRPIAAAAALVLALAVGVFMGRHWPGPGTDNNDVKALRQELSQVREMLTRSLMQQGAASDRIKGVGAVSQLQDPRAELLTSVVDTLMHDPDVNVRLAALRALDRFRQDSAVRQGVVRALAREESPLVTIALIDFVVDMKNDLAIDALRNLARDTSRDAAVRESAAIAAERLMRGEGA